MVTRALVQPHITGGNSYVGGITGFAAAGGSSLRRVTVTADVTVSASCYYTGGIAGAITDSSEISDSELTYSPRLKPGDSGIKQY